jgi:hypothetical protein
MASRPLTPPVYSSRGGSNGQCQRIYRHKVSPASDSSSSPHNFEPIIDHSVQTFVTVRIRFFRPPSGKDCHVQPACDNSSTAKIEQESSKDGEPAPMWCHPFRENTYILGTNKAIPT